MKKRPPKFQNEGEDCEFWETHHSAEYINWKQAKRLTLTSLKPSTKTVSVRLPESMFDELKLLANKQDIPYQSLLKIILAEHIRQELSSNG
jgi:predicted DNA binding CopG/RHH family protein